MSNLTIMIATAIILTCAIAAWLTIRRQRQLLDWADWLLDHDPLTGLLNREGFVAAALVLCAGDRPGIVVLADLDGFKNVNDTYGHDVGDQLLVAVAARIAATAESYGGVAGRLSGDEFAAIVPGRRDGIAHIAETIVTAVAAPLTVVAEGQEVSLAPTVSVGAARIDSGDDIAFGGGLRSADLAMFHAKRAGGGHAIYEPGMTMPGRPPRRGPRLRDLRRRDDGEPS